MNYLLRIGLWVMDFRLYLEKQNQRSIFFFFKQVGVLNQDIYLEFFKHTEC